MRPNITYEKRECPSADEWIKPRWYVLYIQGILSSLKKKEILPFATTWMNQDDIMLSEIRQSQKGKCCMILFCGL